ncbi:hypothetical protein [Mycoplasmopsis alligatoris]|uniref:Conserved domain protein n=1 Tax=Mycoplasmopsis alligatoris A21JP2 TaxID=747682 RepID=D4XWY2_9BACT|nr:hypothetical protein [Mycoplasmopsis alligatoris]EFF41168.1 conserved domain protein [Mycoplasmopsis alligatoris A21JP2]
MPEIWTYLIIFLSIIFIIISIFLFYFFVRKLATLIIDKKISKKKIKLNIETQNCFNINTKIENLSKREKSDKEIYRQVNSVYTEINKKIYKTNSEVTILSHELKKKFSFSFLKFYKKTKLVLKETQDSIDKFMSLAGQLDKKWKLVEDSWSILLDSIEQSKSYLKANELNIKNIGPNLLTNLNMISEKLTHINKLNSHENFSEVMSQIDQIKDELINIIHFVDSAISLEWVIYNNLEKIIQSKKDTEIYQNILDQLHHVKTVLENIEYEKYIQNIIDIYKEIYADFNKNLLIRNIQEIYKKNKVNIDLIYSKIFDLEKNNNNKNLQINIKHYTDAYTSLNSSTSYEDLESFINLSLLIYQKLTTFNYQNLDIDINKTFLEMQYYNNLFYEINSHDMLPKNLATAQISDQIKSSLDICNNAFRKLQHHLDSQNFKTFKEVLSTYQKDLKKLIRILSENIMYKKMYFLLINELSNVKENKNQDQYVQLFYEANQEAENKNYKNAYAILSAYIKKEGK